MSIDPIAIVLKSIDQAFDRKSWHGTNLKGSIKGLSLAEAVWRPDPSRKNIWEHVVHAAYWKYTVYRRLTGEKRGSFTHKGSNWFDRPSKEHFVEEHWKAEVKLLVETHQFLRDAIAMLSPDELEQKPAKSKVSNIDLILGVAAHDIYHAGQIQLLKKLQRVD